MTRICTVPTHFKLPCRCAESAIERSGEAIRRNRTTQSNRARGLTLAELSVVLILMVLLVGLVQLSLLKTLGRSEFRSELLELVNTFQMAMRGAGKFGKRYEVILDPIGQYYQLREITTSDLSVVLDEEIIIDRDLSESCRILYILFDDGDYTDTERAKFRIGRSGWQYGGSIVIEKIDSDENKGQLYTIVVNRLSGIVRMYEGEVAPLEPRSSEEVAF